MSEMIDRAAVAAFKASQAVKGGIPIALADMPVPYQNAWRLAVRGVLQELREPTNAMAEAAQGYTISNDSRQAVWAWEAMIDEALK